MEQKNNPLEEAPLAQDQTIEFGPEAILST